jgi:hypothetical protein
MTSERNAPGHAYAALSSSVAKFFSRNWATDYGTNEMPLIGRCLRMPTAGNSAALLFGNRSSPVRRNDARRWRCAPAATSCCRSGVFATQTLVELHYSGAFCNTPFHETLAIPAQNQLPGRNTWSFALKNRVFRGRHQNHVQWSDSASWGSSAARAVRENGKRPRSRTRVRCRLALRTSCRIGIGSTCRCSSGHPSGRFCRRCRATSSRFASSGRRRSCALRASGR